MSLRHHLPRRPRKRRRKIDGFNSEGFDGQADKNWTCKRRKGRPCSYTYSRKSARKRARRRSDGPSPKPSACENAFPAFSREKEIRLHLCHEPGNLPACRNFLLPGDSLPDSYTIRCCLQKGCS